MDNRRKTVVINSRFQYQYALLAAAVAVLLVNLTIIIHALLAGPPGLLLGGWNILLVAALEVLLIGGVWWGSLVSSNRIAGPVFVLVRQAEALSGGDFTARIRLRKRDVFQPEAEEINRSFDILQLRLQRLKHLVGELEKLPASEPVVPEKIAELKAELDQFKTS